MNKISIIGIGRVGECTAQLIAEKNLCRELMLVDMREGVPQGVALDILETAPLIGFDTRVNGCNQPSGLMDSELVIITTGLARREDLTRTGFLKVAARVIDDIVSSIALYAPNATVLMVSSPVDVLTYQAFLCSGFDRRQVIGHSGVLDSARMASFIGMETGYSVSDISAMVLGGQGDALVPMIRLTSVAGIPVQELLDQQTIDDAIDRTRSDGAEILSLRKTSSTYDAIASSVTQMVDAIAHDRRRVMPATAVLEGEYGFSDVAMGVPCVIGGNGLERIIEISLTDEEQHMFDAAADLIKGNINRLG